MSGPDLAGRREAVTTTRWPLQMHFQPVVDLDGGAVVGFEALARDMRSGTPSAPAEMFAEARAQHRMLELDWLCRTEALLAARQAMVARGDGAGRTSGAVFVNAEAASASSEPPADYLAAHQAVAGSGLVRVLEVTERGLTNRLGPLLLMTERARAAGWRIAVDDVGADWASLALLPFLRPDVIKLDLRLVQDRTTVHAAEVVSAVAVQAARTGALVLAEGIETTAHAALAKSMGATLGQGFLLGRPAPLPLAQRRAELAWPAPRPPAVTGTPWQQLPAGSPVRRAPKALLIGISRWLERQAFALGETAVVLSTFERAEHFTASTTRRYRDLAAGAAVVGVFAQGLGEVAAAGVRAVDLDAGDALCAEWDVLVIGPHFTAALIAIDLGDDGPDGERRFDYLVTYDREQVLAAACPMLARLPDLPEAETNSLAGVFAAYADRAAAPPHLLPAALQAPVPGIEGRPAQPAPSPTGSWIAPVGDEPPRSFRRLTAGVGSGWLLEGATDRIPHLLGSALAASSNGLVVCDAGLTDLPVVYVNAAFSRLAGYPAEELLGRNARFLQGEGTDAEAVRVLHDAVVSGREVRTTLLNTRSDGTTWWNEMNLVPIRDDAGEVTHWVGTQNDVSERVTAQQQAVYLSSHDPMTGLANRRHLTEHLAAEIGRAGRVGSALALLFLDLDGFKAVNDEHGHIVGDELLVAVANRLRDHVRVGDLLVRQGGDEFLVVLSGLPRGQAETAEAALRAAEHLRHQLRMPFHLHGHELRLVSTVSIGVSLWPHDADDDNTLIGHADVALYRAKAGGRDAIATYASS